MTKLTIIIPANNEEKRITKTLEIYSNYLDKIPALQYQILVVINNTTDKTEEIVKTLQKKHKKIEYINLVRGGKGYAVLEGFKLALKTDTELIGFTDADMSTPPEAFHYLVKSLNHTGGIIADRYIKGSVVNPRPTTQRIIVSRIYNALIRSLFLIPYRDTQCGAKLFHRKSLEPAVKEIGMTKWAFDLELLYRIRKNNFRITQATTIWSDKEYSTINFARAGPWMALAVIRLRLLNSPFKNFIRIYDKFISFVPQG